MSKTYAVLSRCILALAIIQLVGGPLSAQQMRRLITQPIDDSNLITLRGNTHRAATLANDRGAVDDSMRLDGMWLLLKRPPEKEKALVQFLDEQQNPNSPNYHKWITAQEMGALYGPAPEDIAAVNRWLESHGFTVNHVYPHGILIDFSGTAGKIRETFHTEIHNIEVNGEKHFANMSDPQIPAALTDIVAGPVQLHNFMPHRGRIKSATNTRITTATGKTRVPAAAGGMGIVAPGDLQTIYNFGPAYAAGYTGTGVTIAIIDDTDVYTTADWGVFRKAFGLARTYPAGSFTQIHPAAGTGGACTDPGVDSAADYSPIVGAEWASAAAPNASIVLASCADGSTTAGGFIALQNLVTNGGPIPGVISLDYVIGEADMTSAGNAYVNSLYQTVAGAGASLFVSSGDSGAAIPIGLPNEGTINVNAYATTPYNVAVGGTDFADAVNHLSTGTYWNGAAGTYFNSALSYVPEITWNDTCADLIFAQYEGYSQTYGSAGFCNGPGFNYTAPYAGASGGGPSAVYAKPAFQSGFTGNPADGRRDIPDVALLAADGLWGHSYVNCFTDPNAGLPPYGAPPTASCAGPPTITWNYTGGTSFSTPIMSGIMALVVQKKGANQGNPVARIYGMAGATYGGTSLSQCNSSGSAISGNCIFYDVTQGDNDVNCFVEPGTQSSLNCYEPDEAPGVLSLSTSSYAPAYPSGIGWDFPTGIGSINVFNFVVHF